MAKWREHLRGGRQQAQQQETEEDKSKSTSYESYDLPCGMSFIRRWTLLKFVPFCPTFLADLKRDQSADGEVAYDVEGAVVTVDVKRKAL